MLTRIARLLASPRLAYLVAHLPHLLVGIVIVLAFTRLVERHEFGVFAIGFAFVNVVGALCFGWLPAALTRLSGGTDEAAGPQASAIVLGMLLPALPCLVLAFALQAYGALQYAWPTALATIGFSASLAVTQLARGLHRPGVYALIGMVRMVLVLGGGWWLTRQFGANAAQLLLALAIGGSVAAAIGLLMLRHDIGARHQASSDTTQFHLSMRQLWRYGWAAAPSIIAVIVMLNADRMLLQWFIAPADIARYSAQADLARQMVYPLVSAMGIGLVPGALNVLRQGDLHSAQRFVIAESRWLLFAAIPLALAAGVFGPVFARLLLPAGYEAGAAPVMALAAFAAFLMACRLLRYDPLFHLILQPRWIGGSALLALGAWTLAMLVLSPRWGGVGAAMAGCVGGVVALLAMHAAARHRIDLQGQAIFPVASLLACLLLGAVAWALHWGLALDRHAPLQAALIAAALVAAVSLPLLWPLYRTGSSTGRTG